MGPLIIVTPFIIKNNFQALQTDNMRLQILRALINIISMICWFTAIGMMHLEKATALGFYNTTFYYSSSSNSLRRSYSFSPNCSTFIRFYRNFNNYKTRICAF